MIMGVLEVIRVIAGFILVLFVPGFALSFALFPHRGDLTDIERLAYSFVLSLLSVMLGVLFMDVKLGLEVTTQNILIVIAFIVLFSVLVYLIQIMLIEAGIIRRFVQALKSPSLQSIKETTLSKFRLKKKDNEK